MKRTVIFLCAVLAVLAMSVSVWRYITDIKLDDNVICVYQDNRLVKRIDLSKVEKAYEFEVRNGDAVNTIYVEKGRVCVKNASCPDQICVKQGYISDGVVPIVCLPNKLIIKAEKNTADVDARVK